MPQSQESVEIVKRFFYTLEQLKEMKVIRGVQTFTRKYNINRRNLYKLKKEMSRDMFELAWLAYLINDYGVSAEWLLTGRGKMFPISKFNKAKERVAIK